MRSYSFSSSSSGVFLVLLAVVLGLFAASGSAVPNWDICEIDGDGIDNDGDGYTDSEDTECGSHYEGFGKISVGGAGYRCDQTARYAWHSVTQGDATRKTLLRQLANQHRIEEPAKSKEVGSHGGGTACQLGR